MLRISLVLLAVLTINVAISEILGFRLLPRGWSTAPAIREKTPVEDFVHRLGIGAFLLVALSTLYSYFKRRRLQPGKTRSLVIRGRKLTLRDLREWHGYLALGATVFTIIHVVPFLDKISLNISFLTTFYFLTVSLSGLIGRYVSKKNALFKEWRRFHVPYTILFYALLVIHIAQKAGD